MRALLKLTLLAALAMLAVPARAQTAYVITRTFTTPEGRLTETYQFGTVSLQTGAYHLITTSKDFEYINSIGFGSDGKLYGLGSDRMFALGNEGKVGDEGIVGMASILVLRVYLIDTATGAFTIKKTYANVMVAGASADSHGVFTGLTIPYLRLSWRLFRLDPVTKVMRYGPQITGQGDGLVVADGRGNTYVGENDQLGYSNDVLAKIINPKTGAAVFVGRTGIGDVRTGLWAGGSLYAFGEHFREEGGEDDRLGVYILNTSTGTAKLVALIPLPSSSTVNAAALAPAPAPRAVSHAGSRRRLMPIMTPLLGGFPTEQAAFERGRGKKSLLRDSP